MNNSILELDILELDTCLCQMYSWKVGHSEIYIKLSTKEKSLYLRFQDVQYYCGPNAWIGASFQEGSPQECLQLLRKFYDYDVVKDKDLILMFRLYRVIQSRFEIEIVSMPVIILNELPDYLGFNLDISTE